MEFAKRGSSSNSNMLTKIVVGIDIGTTSVKTVVVRKSEQQVEIIASSSKSTEAYLLNLSSEEYFEQDVNLILKALDSCVSELSGSAGKDVLSSVEEICVCGQMHGCVLWNGVRTFYPLDGHVTSSLYTWQDQRCSYEFLKGLPLSAASATPLSTGFGVATLIWLLKNEPETLAANTCAATVADFLVSSLCGLATATISPHNAASFGCYDVAAKTWDFQTLNKVPGFPADILPQVVAPGTVVGKLKSNWHGINEGTRVQVALGDLQCSVLSCEPKMNEAVINISTSAQVALICNGDVPVEVNQADPYLPAPVLVLPYFDDLKLRTSCSLNGGAVFASYVQMLLKWTQKFAPQTTADDVYTTLLSGNSRGVSSGGGGGSLMRIAPSIYGERHQPDKLATFTNVNHQDFDAHKIARQIATGILKNLHEMFYSSSSSSSSPSSDDFSHIWASGGAFKRNQLFRDAVEAVFDGKSVAFDRDCDAAYGAAIYSLGCHGNPPEHRVCNC